jgi:hypothetical protein
MSNEIKRAEQLAEDLEYYSAALRAAISSNDVERIATIVAAVKQLINRE